jgi:hypothetical protein
MWKIRRKRNGVELYVYFMLYEYRCGSGGVRDEFGLRREGFVARPCLFLCGVWCDCDVNRCVVGFKSRGRIGSGKKRIGEERDVRGVGGRGSRRSLCRGSGKCEKLDAICRR